MSQAQYLIAGAQWRKKIAEMQNATIHLDTSTNLNTSTNLDNSDVYSVASISGVSGVSGVSVVSGGTVSRASTDIDAVRTHPFMRTEQ
jgi:hypothetical protein